MAKYKLWVQIERVGDEEADEYENISEPVELDEFGTEEEARECLEKIEEFING